MWILITIQSAKCYSVLSKRIGWKNIVKKGQILQLKINEKIVTKNRKLPFLFEAYKRLNLCPGNLFPGCCNKWRGTTLHKNKPIQNKEAKCQNVFCNANTKNMPFKPRTIITIIHLQSHLSSSYCKTHNRRITAVDTKLTSIALSLENNLNSY